MAPLIADPERAHPVLPRTCRGQQFPDTLPLYQDSEELKCAYQVASA
jgi:hypothetical protein